MSKRRILLVEDEELLRLSLKMFLNSNGFDVCEAADEKNAISLMNGCSYSLVITDLFLSDGSGFGIMKHIQDNCPEARCIVITGHASLDSAIRALRKGACDYILKPFEFKELNDAVERSFKKQSDECTIRKLDFNKIAKTYSLTKKEVEIVKVVVTEGASNAELSELLEISLNTVKVHLRNIFKKIEVESKNELTTTLLSGGSK